MFDDLFPRAALKFDVSALSGLDWLDGLEEGNAQILWSIAVLSDDLLRACASFHGEGDLFLSRRFLGKWSNLRYEMAAKSGRTRKDAIPQSDKADWQGFLDFRLTDELLAELDAWKPKPTEVWDEADGLTASGYRLTLSYNPRTHLASCTVICDDPAKAWGGWALSSSDENGALALKMAVFKHIKLNRDWSTLLGQPAAKGRRG